MDTWLAWKLLILLIIFIGGSESCYVIHDRTIDEVMEANTRSPWLVLVIDQRKKRTDKFYGESYGSLIKDDIVLTAASKMTRFSPDQLEVIINWQKTTEIHCDSRLILFLTYPPNFDMDQVKPSDWVLLNLYRPFELYDRVNIIPLADKNNPWNSDDCLIYHWTPIMASYRIATRHINEEGFIHQQYQVSLTPGSSGLYKKEEVKLHNDVDCVINQCNLSDDSDKSFKNISFVESPIVCKLLNQDQYVQVGFTNFVNRLIVNETENGINFQDISEYDQDTFVDLTKDFDELIIPEIYTDNDDW